MNREERELTDVGKAESGISLEDLVAKIDGELVDEAPAPGEIALATEEGPAPGYYGGEQYIRFYMGELLMAIPLSSALEIGQIPDVTPLPNLPNWVLGVSNIRGEVVSVVDLKTFFGMPVLGISRTLRIMIVHNNDMKVGFVVDRVLGIFNLDRSGEEIRKSPYAEGEISDYISGVIATDDALLNILDIEKLLSSPRMNAFREE